MNVRSSARALRCSAGSPAGRMCLAVALAAVAVLTLTATAHAGQGGFLTIQFGRTQLGMAAAGCRPMENSVPLGRVARRMHRMGFAGTGAVVVDLTSSSRPFTCHGLIRYPGWQRLHRLHQRYGWNFVSAGARYIDPRRLSRSAQERDICGSLAAFREHGLARAWGLFAYPGDRSDSTLQRSVTSRCFAYGRTYNHSVNSRSSMAAPWFQRTFSVDGGACNIRGLACYRIVTPVWPAHYKSPGTLAGLMSPAVGQWRDVQFYRLVKRRHLAGAVRWDCRGSDWRAHWTTRIELYCAKDFFRVLKAIPDRVRVVDPAAVAKAWGRIPPDRG